MDSSDIPMDVMEEILMRLPVKHVLRCKSLSKTYYALIKNPRFIKKHLPFCSRSNGKKIITVFRKQSQGARANNIFSVESSSSSLLEVYAPTTDKTRSNARMFLLGSCNGLVCAVFDPWQAELATIELWNPATREHRTIPRRPKSDPYNSYMGFGYDSTSDDYKLVVITLPDIRRVQWWSMKTNDWTEVITGPGLVTVWPNITHSTGLYIRGKLYWLASIRNNENNHVSNAIMSFDLVNNSLCSEAAVPDALAGKQMSVFDFMGSIALSACYGYPTPKFDIWVMNNDCNKTWAMKFTIGPLPCGFRFTRVCTDGELLITNEGQLTPRFLLYDLRNKKQKPLLPRKLPNNHDHVSPPCSYYESLVSVLDYTSKQ